MGSFSPLAWWAFFLAMLPAVLGTPLLQERAQGAWMALDTNFPDPSVLQTPDGKWYAYGTNGNGKRVQVATSNDFQTWTLLDIEALPTISSWELDKDHWAPDVIMRVSCPEFRLNSWSMAHIILTYPRTTESS